MKNDYMAGSIPKSVMENIPSDPLDGSKTRSVSPARKLRSDPGFPHISPREMSHARPALLTVFSTTQLDHLKPQDIYNAITVLGMLTTWLKSLKKKRVFSILNRSG
jgi:hypothetical protein